MRQLAQVSAEKLSLLSGRQHYGDKVLSGFPDQIGHDQQQCVSRDKRLKIFSDELCAVANPQQGMPSGGCPGDSGGLLLSPQGKLVGVTSWGQYNNCEKPAGKRSTVLARVSSGQQWLRQQTGQPLFGLPAISQNTAAPEQIKVSIKPVPGKAFSVTASAAGQDWKAIVTGTLTSVIGRRGYQKSFRLTLDPGHSTQQLKIPRGFRSSKIGFQVFLDARFYNSLMNGSSSMPEMALLRLKPSR